MRLGMLLAMPTAFLTASVGAQEYTAPQSTSRGTTAAVDTGSRELLGTGWSINAPIPEPLGVAQGAPQSTTHAQEKHESSVTTTTKKRTSITGNDADITNCH
jgi:hypothetical protein